MIGHFRMIHLGFGPNHPTNQDDRRFSPQDSFFFSEMLGLSSYCHPGLKMAISAQHGPIILPSSWVVRLTVSVRAIILLSSYRQCFHHCTPAPIFFSFTSSWHHPSDLLCSRLRVGAVLASSCIWRTAFQVILALS